MPQLRKWKCVYCGDDVIEGQRFFWIPGRKGYAHIECVYERLLSQAGENLRDLVAVMDANEVLAYAIVRLKEASRMASSEEVKEEITRVRREIERLAAELEAHELIKKLE